MEIAGVKCETNGRSMTVTIEGDIDHHSAKYIRDQIDTAIFYCRPREMIMELGKVTFMDSSGLGLILGRYTRMAEIGGKLTLSHPSPQTEKILHLAGVGRMIQIQRETQEAATKTERKKNAHETEIKK
jgi:stage II sporulation protein AA (anti-sigma F factor antagonist)